MITDEELLQYYLLKREDYEKRHNLSEIERSAITQAFSVLYTCIQYEGNLIEAVEKYIEYYEKYIEYYTKINNRLKLELDKLKDLKEENSDRQS